MGMTGCDMNISSHSRTCISLVEEFTRAHFVLCCATACASSLQMLYTHAMPLLQLACLWAVLVATMCSVWDASMTTRARPLICWVLRLQSNLRAVEELIVVAFARIFWVLEESCMVV